MAQGKVNTLHFQARLNRQYIREADAVAFYEAFTAQHPDLTQRTLLCEALLALGGQVEQGYVPPEPSGDILLTRQMQQTLQQISSLVAMLSKLDLSSARQSQGWSEQTFQDGLEAVNQSAANIFGLSKTYSEDD